MARHAHDPLPSGIAGAPAAVLDAPGGEGRDIGSPSEAACAGSPGSRGSERSCIVTRAALPPDQLIRFVLSPQGVVTPDIRRTLPGRGVWVTANRGCVAEASRRNAFARAFKKEAVLPANLAAEVGDLLRKDALQALSLASKAGALTSGFEKTRSALESGEVLALIEASDGSAEGRKKLVGVLRRRARSPESAMAEPCLGEPTIIESFTSLELDLALGRPHVIHAALLRAPAGGFAVARCLRLHRFELIEKHASGGAERCGTARKNRNVNAKPNRQLPAWDENGANRAAGQKSE
ncbi:MAG: RNA-binding protein [Hyphomicrobiales bacterium]|nr:RNA-binding protein [Hyphomicrobiales bacterium]